MKASELIKHSLSIEAIYKEIEQINSIQNQQNHFKHFIPHWIYVSDYVKMQLVNDGFKIYNVEFYKGESGLIIEW